MIKVVLLILVISISSLVYSGECYLGKNVIWREATNFGNRLQIRVVDDRNLYLEYLLENTSVAVLLSHKVYACSDKFLSFLSEDDSLENFAVIETLPEKGAIRLYFQKSYEELGNIVFVTH